MTKLKNSISDKTQDIFWYEQLDTSTTDEMYSGSLLRSHAFTQNPLFPIPRRTPSSKWSGEFLTLPYGMQDIHQTSSIPIDICISENKQLLYWPLYNHDCKIWQIDWKKMTALVHLSKTRTRTSSGRNTHTFAIGLLLLLMQEAKKVILVCKDGERQLKLFNISGSES